MSLLTGIPEESPDDDVEEDNETLLLLQAIEARLTRLEDRVQSGETQMAKCMSMIDAMKAEDKAEEAKDKAEDEMEKRMFLQMLDDERAEHATTRKFITSMQQEMAKLVKAMVTSNKEDAKEDKQETKQLTFKVTGRDGNNRVREIVMTKG